MFTKAEQDVFYKAVLSRDYRFDGRFFTGVKTTGIYCRPVCPALPLRKNMVFFKTAQAAESAGFRPCLRCRPEVAPQSPAWIGKSAVVKRAIGLISDGQLFNSSERAFAAKLGVSERHLRRLFASEIGMTAKQISDAQRLNFARTLIAETKMPITDIALNSGFNSIRRFNDAFYRKFLRRPSEIRRAQKQETDTSSGPTEITGGTVTLYLRYRPPYDWNSILNFFRAHSAPGMEAVINDSYQRLFLDENSGKPALVTVSHAPERHSLKLEVTGGHTRSLFAISRRVRRMFDLDSDPILIAAAFAKLKLLEKLHAKNPGLRLPRAWDPFEMAVATVLGQFVSVEHARMLMGQLVRECGTTLKHSLPTELAFAFPSAAELSKATLSTVKTTGRRKETIRALAALVSRDEIELSEPCEPSRLREQLARVKGIGPWSIEYICLRAIGDTDAFPAKDLILARVLEKHRSLARSVPELQPWRSYLAIYLWKEFAHAFSKKRRKKMLYRKSISSPVGRLTLVASDKCLRALMFEEDKGDKDQTHDKNYVTQFGAAKSVKSHPILDRCERELKDYFAGRLKRFTVPLDAEGTEFQRKVWSALTKIPYGRCVSYGEQAAAVGKRKAVRAVAAANGRNPIAIIIPCHRVIASTGHLHGYGGGLDLKRKLLEIEGIRIDNLKVIDAN